MSATHASIEDHHEPGLYEIRIKGHLDNRWADWFEGLTITLEDNGETLLTGPVVDQAALHGLLRKLDETLAVGYLAARIVECAIMMVGIFATLLLIPLSQEFLKAGAPQNSWFLSIGDVLRQAKFLGLTGLSFPLLGLGGLLFTWMLFRFRLVPRVISVVGLIGYALVFLSGMGNWFGVIDPSVGGNGAFLAIPVAVFEIILLPFWLLFRGFKMPEAPEHPAAE